MAERFEQHDDRLDVVRAATAEAGRERLAAGDIDCVLAADDLRDRSGLSFLETVRNAYPNLPFVLFSERDSAEVALEAIDRGATDHFVTDAEAHYPVLVNRIIHFAESYRQTQVVESAEMNWKSIEKQAGDIYYMFSGDWETLLYINPAYERIWGASVAELQADPYSFLDYVHPRDRHIARGAMSQLSAGEPAEFEYRVTPPLGTERWVHGVSEPIVDDDGNVTRVTGSVRDITHIKKREQQLRVLARVLRHNVRNRMNVVAGFAETIAAESSGDIRTYADHISSAADDLVELSVKQKRIVELITQNTITEPLDIATETRRRVEGLRSSYPEAEIRCEAPEKACVFAVRDIGYAVEQLAENAVVHSESSPVVEVSVVVAEREVAVAVTDNNDTIPPLEVAVIQGEVDIDQLSHSRGLGLWLVNWLVSESDGQVAFEECADGNRVRLVLPKTESDEVPTHRTP